MGLETNKVNYKESWHLLRLKELCSRISDGTHFTPEYVNTGIPFISVKDIYNEKVNFNKCKFISKEAHQELIKRCFPEKDDVLITKSGTIGRMALVPEKPEFSLFVSVALLKNKKELIHSKFLKYCLENFLNHINIAQDIKGGLLKNFHLEDIRETVIPQVSLTEQQTIVSKIEELLSDLENGKQQLQIALQQLKIYRQSLLKWAFEGKLTKGTMIWRIIMLKDASIKIVVGYVGPITEHIVEKEGVKFISTTHIGENEFLFHDIRQVSLQFNENNKKSQVVPGDIIIARHGDSGKACIIPNSIELAQISNAVILRPNPEILNSKFICYRLNAERQRMQKMKVGGVLQVVNTKSMETFQISIPPLAEQQLIVDELESKLTVCDKIEETISQSLLQAESLRQSILKKAFEGKLV